MCVCSAERVQIKCNCLHARELAPRQPLSPYNLPQKRRLLQLISRRAPCPALTAATMTLAQVWFHWTQYA